MIQLEPICNIINIQDRLTRYKIFVRSQLLIYGAEKTCAHQELMRVIGNWNKKKSAKQELRALE